MAKNKNSFKNANKKGSSKTSTKVTNSNKVPDTTSATTNTTKNVNVNDSTTSTNNNSSNNGNKIDNKGFDIDNLLNNKNLPPISAIFLGKFDVHTGYTLKWFKNLDNLNNNKNLLDGLEFKILPSGLHSIEKDTICFIQPKSSSISTISDNQNLDEFNCYYGISIFRQNSSHLKTTITNNSNGTSSINRNDVKMYSLGILIDPIHANSFYNSNLLNSITWKPKLFSSCWNYNKILDNLLIEFMKNTDLIINNNYLIFEKFFENYKFIDLNNSNNKFKNIIKNVNYNRKKSISNINNSIESDKNLNLNLTSSNNNTTNNNTPIITNSDHMILSLFKLIDDLGPSIFTIWKLALLRKKLILFAEAPPSSVELYSSTPTSEGETTANNNTGNIEEENNIHDHDEEEEEDSYHPKISDFSKFVYDISLLSSVPQEIKLSLLKSGISEEKLNNLEILKPIYNLCVNDIDYLKKLDKESPFIGSTTDQIILDKSNLYDYAVKIPSYYKKPNSQPSNFTDTPQTPTSTSDAQSLSPSSLATADNDSNINNFNHKSSKSKTPSSNLSLSSSTFVPSSSGNSIYSLPSSQSNNGNKHELDIPLILESKNFRTSLAKSSVKSSQRDMKRFLLLFHSIFDNFKSNNKFNKPSKNIIKQSKPQYHDDIGEEDATFESNVEAPLLPSLTTSSSTAVLNIDDSNDDDDEHNDHGDASADYYEASELQEQNEQLMNYYKGITEPMSIREFIWKGFSWWATAGSDGNDEDELEYDRILLGNLILKNSNGADMNETDSKIENVLLLVGYFQSLTVKIFSMLIDLINNNESAKDSGSRNKQRQQHQGDDSNNTSFDSADDESEALLSHDNGANETESHSDDIIYIEHRDIYEMGLDPYSEFDVFFLTELVDLWWDKKVKIGTYLGNLCCI
ncbi:hypothetical protein B5S31_g973 [[Candida] boidinii]|nr:hypothetical protein B5S31_g973 [[Candida] boidinii]